ncbi:hypothetical protein FACS1894195_1090 [Bacteroidia bacterium]|nr:hypothetical protein FACS1894195_1090 [Bacteroidia bacterium]
MYHPLQVVCGLVKHIKFTVMTVREQQEQSKMEPYAEASRYLNNAEDTLKKTRKEDGDTRCDNQHIYRYNYHTISLC